MAKKWLIRLAIDKVYTDKKYRKKMVRFGVDVLTQQEKLTFVWTNDYLYDMIKIQAAGFEWDAGNVTSQKSQVRKNFLLR